MGRLVLELIYKKYLRVYLSIFIHKSVSPNPRMIAK